LLAARYRVEVRDKEGKPVTVLEGDSKSFTMNFIKLLIASHYNQNDVPTFVIYNVAGSPLYTGYIQTPYVGVPWRIFNIDYGFYGYVPAIWLGSSSCANPALANGPCGSPLACCFGSNYPFSPYFVGPSALCYGLASCSPSLTEEGWAVTITDQWLNVSGSPVTVASMALVFGVVVAVPAESSQYDPETSWGPTSFITEPYAAIVDNLSTPVTVWPGFLLTVSYTIYFPV
jgi:hypothetical protein